MTAVLTNVGATLWATAIQSASANAAITYVSVGLGAGTLSVGLTSGNTYTSLTLNAGTPGAIANGQSLTLINSAGGTQVVTANPGEVMGATTIRVNSFMASANFAIGSGVANTPAVTDNALQNESYRITATVGAAGASAGESLNGAYFDPTTPTGSYVEVGYYGGGTATSTLGTGILIFRDVQWFNHTLNADSAYFQADSTL